MLRWTGFADFWFPDSAPLAFARAIELAETDVYEEHPEAWVVEDRQVTFSLETESTRQVIASVERLLDLLAHQALRGEAVIEIHVPPERWVRRAASDSFPDEPPMGSEEATEGPHSRTIPTRS